MNLQSSSAFSVFFFLFFFIVLCSAQSPAVPASPFTPTEAENHSPFSWDYGALGEASGWWGYWYPTCSADDQSPIDVNSTTAVSGSDTLVVETTSGEPFAYRGAIVAFESLFNQIHLDLAVGNITTYLRYASTIDTPDPPVYTFLKVNLFFPSAHTLDNTTYDGEIMYTFQGTEYDPDTAPTGTTLTSKTMITLCFFLTKVADGTESTPMKRFLTQMYDGADIGSTQITPYIPPSSGMYQYSGTEVHPPCKKGYQYFVSELPIKVDVITLQSFLSSVSNPTSNNTLKYRAIQPLGTRTITKFDLNVSTLVPHYDDEAFPVTYRLSPSPLKYTGIIEKYVRDVLIAIIAVLCAVCGYLLVKRCSHRLPYNLSWVNPASRMEVFGVPLRYGYETGRPKPECLPSGSTEDIEEEQSSYESDSNGSSMPEVSNPLNGKKL